MGRRNLIPPVSLVSAVVFILLLLAAQTAAVIELDRRAVLAAAGLRTSGLTELMKAVTFWGTKDFLFPATALVTAFLFWRKNRFRLTFPLAMLAAWLVMEVSKLLIARPRPDFCPLLPETSFSFPSGHTFMGVLFFGFLAGLISQLFGRHPFLRKNRRPPGKTAVFALACFFLALLGFTRLYLGVHYPTDLLAGYAGGLFFLGLLAGRPKNN